MVVHMVRDESSKVPVNLCMQDCNSLHVEVMICATLVNTYADKQLLTGNTISSAETAELVLLSIFCHFSPFVGYVS